MTVLSPLARGKGSWEGDLESTPSKSLSKPVLKHHLQEDTDFLDKSVTNPIRVKSRLSYIKSIVQEVSKQKTQSMKDGPPSTFAEYLHSKVPSTELSRPKTSKSQRRFHSKPSRVVLNPKKHQRVKSAPVKCHAEYDGQLNLPKTYVTRKGALMLFVSPDNLAFSQENDEKCYFYDPNDVDTAQLALQEMRTLDNLTASVLKYGDQKQIFRKLANTGRLGNTNMSYPGYNREEPVDLRTQPGGDFYFYLRDVQAKASYRNLVRSPSRFSINSEEATEDLNSALKSLDDGYTESHSMLGESTVHDFSTAGDESTRDWVKSSVSTYRAPHVTCDTPASGAGDGAVSEYMTNRPNTGSRSLRSSSVARTTTPLSFKEIAMSIKSAPYLGRPLSAAYPSTYSAYIPTPPPFEHDTHPSEEEEDFEPPDGPRPSSRFSTRSQKSASSSGTKSNRSQKSAPSHRSSGGFSPNKHLTPAEDPDESTGDGQRMSVISRSSRKPSGGRRSSSRQSICLPPANEDEDTEAAIGKTSEIDRGASAGSRRSRVSWVEEGQQEPEDDDEEEEDDWRSEIIDVAISESGEPAAIIERGDIEVKDGIMIGEEDIDLPEETHEMEREETSAGRRARSRVSSASPRRIYTPRTRSSGRTTPIDVDGDVEEPADPRIPSATSSTKRSTSRTSHRAADEIAEEVSREVEEPAWHADDEDDGGDDGGDGGYEELATGVKEVYEVLSDNARDASEPPQIQEDKTDAKVEKIEIPEREEAPREAERKTPEQLPKPRTMLLEDTSVMSNRNIKPDLPVPKKSSTIIQRKEKSHPAKAATENKTVTVVTMPERKPDVTEDPAPKASAEKPKMTGVAAATLASVKAKNAGKKSPRSGRKSKGTVKKKTFTGPQFEFVGSVAIDPYVTGPSKEEMDDMIAEELAKELAAQNLEIDKKEEEVKPGETEQEEVDSLATDDEAIEKELKKTRAPSKKKESKKKMAKERAALKEARRLEKQRREEEMKVLEEKKRKMEEERRRLEEEEKRRKEELANRIEEAELEAEMARQAEEDAKLMMQEARRIAREEREAKRKEDAERRKMERDKQREERKKMEEQARQREREMAEKLASAEEQRQMKEAARIQREEQERLEQEERERLEEEELMRMEEEEEKIRELERQAEREAMERLVMEREAAEENRRQAETLRKQQEEAEEKKRQEELERKAKEEERQLLMKIEEEQKREKELERIRQIQQLEEEARFKVRRELERRRARALRRREFNVEQQGHMNGLRRTQGMTKPWVYTYYIHWPRDTYERKLPSADKKKRRGTGKARAKTAPPVMIEAKSNMVDSATGP